MSAWLGLVAVLAGVPDLEGARCATGKRYELFDIEDPADERAEAARNLCGTLTGPHCPALAACCDYADTLRGHRRPGGTLAGQTHAHRPVAPPKLQARGHTPSAPTSASVGKARGALHPAGSDQ